MKRLLLLTLIFLTACSSAEPTAASYFAPFTPAASPQPDITLLTPDPAQTSMSAEESGELYFFLTPRQAGASIQLAKASGVCVFDSVNCPPLQTVNVPFPFNFTINALSWSPDGNYAAFSYPDNINGTPTKLWLFDPVAGTWTSLAEFPYIDPPFWSPDSAWIAFRTQDGYGGEDVHVVRRDGSELKSVGTNLPFEGRPYIMDGWYGDSNSQFIFMRPAIPASTGNIYLVRASDGAVSAVFGSSQAGTQFIPAPDMSLQFVYDEYDSNTQSHNLKLLQPQGGTMTLASVKGDRIYPIVWSPDSQWIAFNVSSLVNGVPVAEVYLVSRDGKKMSSIYKGTTVGRLVFSPKGNFLLVEENTSASGGYLSSVNLATLETKMLQAPGLSTDYNWYAPSWRP